MLVCSISQRPPRRAIAADVAEVAEALDATTTGFVVFATLVDDPASVLDVVDAYLGEIMVEAASATDTVDAGLFFSASIDESVTATDTSSATSSALPTRSAMVAGLQPVFVNPSISRSAYVEGVMVNL